MTNTNNYQGDLADIFRDGNNTASGESSTSVIPVPDGWQFPSVNYSTSGIEELTPVQDFGDPFCNLRDPVFHDFDINSCLFSSTDENNNVCTSLLGPKIHDAINSSKTCLEENSGLQISSPRNTGIKRRKSQAKKVVCIPAPAPANSRQGGEVVPSDLWAWRKYGQKPIKGSPYPRGYYRCSSSKGCSARKQVERSRTDPNMLVITYTSEHNHPWPTQRNALAGSTRSQPHNSKHTSTSKNNIIVPNNSQSRTNTSFKEDEQKESNNINHDDNVAQVNMLTYPIVKEEVAEEDSHQQVVEMHDVEFCKGSYQPILPDSSNQCHDDFFADLVKLEADPLDLLYAENSLGGYQ
ncbi:unnamed protein product [Withania somnifera]